MSFWETNAAILDGHYPGLREEILREEDIDSRDIETETAASGDLTAKIRGVYIHSNRDPGRESRRLAESLRSGESPADRRNGSIVILGFGLGYAAQAAGELWPDRPLIIVEKYRYLLRTAMEQRDLSAMLARPQVAFIAGGSGDGIAAALSLFEDDEKTAPSVIRNRALTGMDEEWYGNVENRIRTWTMRDDVNAATLKRFGRRWIKNLSRNISCIRDRPGISRLTSIASDMPVFLAAAGPGLDQIGPFLPEIRERCIVVAVDTSVRFLLNRGVTPDFAVIVDPQFWNSRHLDRQSVKNIRLIAESAAYPPVLRLPFKGIYLCSPLFPLGSFIEQRVDAKGRLGAGGSVATTAWDFCRILAPEHIFIAGLDLAFPGYKTHFRGAAFEEKSHAQSNRLNPSETWLARSLRDGIPFRAPAAGGRTAANTPENPAAADSTVLTDRRLSLYAAWFENRFSQYPVIRNYSLSSGGLAITGLEYAPMDKLLSLPARRSEIDRIFDTAFARMEAEFYNPENAHARAERYEEAVLTLRHGLAEIKAAAERGTKIAQQALKQNYGAREQDKILKDLDKITRSISDSEVKEVAGFLFPPAEAVDADSGSTDPFRAYLESSARFYRSLAEAAEFNLREMEKHRRGADHSG
jgi:hypothetical protein